MKGRKPQPTRLKLLRGNPSKRKPRTGEPKPEGAKPDCPAHLEGDARQEWDRLSGELFALGLLTRLDAAPLAAYCVSFARWVEAEAGVKEMGLVVKSPTGFPQKNPFLSIAEESLRQMRAFATEFGLSPSSRTRIQIPTPTKAKTKLAAFLEGSA